MLEKGFKMEAYAGILFQYKNDKRDGTIAGIYNYDHVLINEVIIFFQGRSY